MNYILIILITLYLGHSEFFYEECAGLAEESCLQLLNEVMGRKRCRSNALEFLTKAWESKKVDCSEIKLKTLLTDKTVSDSNVLSWFLESGVVVDRSDIQLAIQCLPDGRVESFKLLLGKCKHVDKDYLCRESWKAKKILFVVELLNEGAALPKEYEAIISRLLSSKKFEGVEAVLNLLSREQVERLDLAKLLSTNLVYSDRLLTMFIDYGVNPNAKKSPVVTLWNSTHLKAEARVKLICLLLKCGANCNQLSYIPTYDTSPLHVATELSLKAGELIIKLVDSLETYIL